MVCVRVSVSYDLEKTYVKVLLRKLHIYPTLYISTSVCVSVCVYVCVCVCVRVFHHTTQTLQLHMSKLLVNMSQLHNVVFNE